MRKLMMAIAMMTWGSTATAEPVTLAALGDSLTQGYGLAPDQGFVPRLQAWLAAQGAKVEIINAGVSGDTTAGGLARLAWTLTPEVDGLIVALGANDALRGIEPAVARDNLAQILTTARSAGLPVLLIGTRAPGNFGPDYSAAFEAIYPALAEEYSAAYAPDFLAALAAQGDTPADYAPYLQADGLHPNPDGLTLILDDLGPHVLALVETAQAGG